MKGMVQCLLVSIQTLLLLGGGGFTPWNVGAYWRPGKEEEREVTPCYS